MDERRHRRGRRDDDRHPGRADRGGGVREAPPHGGGAARRASSARKRRSRRCRAPSAATAPGCATPSGPIGSFIFLGPTGRGQDRAGARRWREFLFDDPRRADPHRHVGVHGEVLGVAPRSARLRATSGYEEGGQLTEKVRRKPYSVVLLDEIEKAHPDVFNILLQVLDDGQLTDSLRRKVDFKNTVLIMTSNLGARQIKGGRGLGFQERDDESAYGGMKRTILDELKKSFNPEFLNRIDEAIVFHSLDRPQMAQITHILLEQVADRLKANGIRVTLDDSVVELLIEKGFDPSAGARPLRRTIMKYVEDPLSDEMLRGTFRDGDSVRIDIDPGKEQLSFGRWA